MGRFKKGLFWSELAASQKRIQLEFETELTRAPMIGDASRLRQVVENLIDNAIKFSSEGGVVRVELAQEGTGVTLRVVDEGAGIESPAQPHLFNRFSQTEHLLGSIDIKRWIRLR